MVEIHVLSRIEMKKRLRDKERFDAIISLNDSDSKLLWEIRNRHEGPVLPLFFDDLNEPVFGYIHPDAHDIQRIIKFCENVSGKIAIHCHAGVCRSSAAGVICATVNGEDPYEWTKGLIERQAAWPNALMLKLADDELGTNMTDAAEKAVSEWEQENDDELW